MPATLCAWCQRQETDPNATTSHGICPTCINAQLSAFPSGDIATVVEVVSPPPSIELATLREEVALLRRLLARQQALNVELEDYATSLHEEKYL